MNFYSLSLLLCLQFIFVHCDKLENATDAASSTSEKSSSSSLFARKARAIDFVYADLIGCAVQSDPSCLVNVAEDFLSIKKNELLSQADQEVIKATGRSDPSNSPSELTKTMEKLISDLTGLFKSGMSSFFRDSDDSTGELADDEEDDAEESKDNENQDVGAQDSEVARKKKKKKYGPLKKLIHKILIFVVIVFTLKYILKFYYAGLATKHLLISKGYFLLYALKLYFQLKHAKTEHAIVYEHSHHDYHEPAIEHHALDYGGHESHETYEHEPYWDAEDRADYGFGHNQIKRKSRKIKVRR